MRISKLLAAAVVSFAFSGAAQAAVLTVNEFIDGDLNGQTLAPVDIGVNTVAGNLTFCPAGSVDCPADLTDAFSLNIGAGLQVTSVSLLIFSEGSVAGVDTISTLYNSSISGFFGTLSCSGNTASVTPTLTGAPIFQTQIQSSAGAAGGVGYRWSFTVEAVPPQVVPLPAGLPLLAAGLGALGLLRRRRAHG